MKHMPLAKMFISAGNILLVYFLLEGMHAGLCSAAALEEKPVLGQTYLGIVPKTINIYSEPNLRSKVVTTLWQPTKILILSIKDDWLQINILEKNMKGWIEYKPKDNNVSFMPVNDSTARNSETKYQTQSPQETTTEKIAALEKRIMDLEILVINLQTRLMKLESLPASSTNAYAKLKLPTVEAVEQSIRKYEGSINLGFCSVSSLSVIDIKQQDDYAIVRAQVRTVYNSDGLFNRKGAIAKDKIEEYMFRLLNDQWKLFDRLSGAYY